jgi:hypothetical protein
MTFDQEKFKALVLHILWRTNHYDDFGATKLNKVLWFSEARSFEAYGEPITGEVFIRDKHGPRSKHAREVCEKLRAEGLAESSTEHFYEYEVQRYRALQPSDTSAFTGEELSLIDWWIDFVAKHHTAKSISEKSHEYGWEIAKMGEEIPLRAFLASRVREPRHDEEIDWAKKEAERLGIK